nr:hypothetical protein [Tanacetum cinerariifolium]
MTTPNVTSSTDSQMYNNIMAAGSRDRPPMLAPGRYPQWRSRFLRYVDTRPNSEALRQCILSGPYKPTTVLVHAVEAPDDSPAVPEHTIVETLTNMSPENKAHFLAEKEVIHLILTGIGDDIYSPVDACQTAQETWEAIERLQQGESLNIQDVNTNLFWEFDKFTSHDGESMESYYTRFYKLMNEMIRNNLTVMTMQVNVQFLQQLQPEWSRFVTIVKQQHKLDEVSYHKLFDILKQYQNEVNELRAKKLARNANPLALVTTAQATFEDDNDPEQAQRDKDMQKNLALIAMYFKKIYKPTNNNLRTSSNSKNKIVDTTPRYKNDDHSGQFGTQRTVNVAGTREKVGSQDSAYHKEKMLLCKQAEQGVSLQAKQYDCNTCLVETNDSNVTPDSPDMCEDDIQNDQNDAESDDERVALADLIANLKLDVDENKKIQKQLKKANTTLAQELKECKTILTETTKKSVINTNVPKPGLYRIDNRIAHTRAPQLPQTVRNTNPRVSTSTGVNHKPTVSRPQLKSNQSRDKVMPNNSQVKAKKTKVEVHPRIPSISNKTKSVTACKDSSNSRTLNANAICATCNKCLVNSNHFACITKMLNDVHDRIKKPNVVPISTRKPKSQVNNSIATPHKKKIVQLILFIVDSRFTKHMTGNLKLLCNFVEKFLGTVRFGNDQFAPILGYGDLVQGNVTINRVYYVEGLNHNLFSVGQFCDADLTIAFRKSTLSHLNFDYINLLSKKDIVIGLPKLKYVKDQLCSSCELSKAKRSSFKSKVVPSSKGRLNLLHMDLCGPMRSNAGC